MFKTRKFSLFVLATLLMVSSCSKEEPEVTTCAQSDWVGSYTATSDCNPDIVETLDVVITEGTEENQLIFTDEDGDDSIITINGCDIVKFSVFTLTFEGTLTGDSFT